MIGESIWIQKKAAMTRGKSGGEPQKRLGSKEKTQSTH